MLVFVQKCAITQNSFSNSEVGHTVPNLAVPLLFYVL